MEEIHIVLSLIPQRNWEFIDFISGPVKLEKIKKFAEIKIAELTEALNKEEKNIGYLQRTLIKVLDNLHINIKNVHLRIEEPTKSPFFSLGFTLEELMVINTDENWKEIFIDRNIYKDLNVYKILRIENLGFYLMTNENMLFSNIKEKELLKKSICDSFPKSAKFGKDFEYLIKPISLTSKLKQNNEILKLPKENKNEEKQKYKEKDNSISNINNTINTNKDSIIEENNNDNNNDSQIEGFSKIKIYIHLDKFDINFQKSQFDTIIRILNHISNYQKYQLFNYESRKCYYFRPKMPIEFNINSKYRKDLNVKNENKKEGKDLKNPNNKNLDKSKIIKSWWRYAFTCIKKRLKYLQGNEMEYERSEIILKNYEKNYEILYEKFLKDLNKLTEEENNLFMEIISKTEINNLYQWSLKGIKEYFTLNKIQENKKNKSGLMGKIFGRKINEENLLSVEEIKKIEEIFESSNRQIKNELILSSKEIKLKIEFMLSEGSFVFSRNKDNDNTKESFSFKYKNLCFNLKKGENFSEIDAQLKDFVIDMITIYNKNKIKTTNITYYDKDFVNNNINHNVTNINSISDKNNKINNFNNTEIKTLNEDEIINIDIGKNNIKEYIWKLNVILYSPEEKINSKLNLDIVN
jgi:hypothetical protein